MIAKIVIALLAVSVGFLIGVFYRGRLEPKFSGTMYFIDENDAYVAYDSVELMNQAKKQRYMRLYVENNCISKHKEDPKCN